MNKPQLIEQLAQRNGLDHTQAEEVVSLIFGKICESLTLGKRAEFRGFGSFTVKNYQSYWGRNPKTGEKILVAPKCLPSFKFSTGLSRRLEEFSQKLSEGREDAS